MLRNNKMLHFRTILVGLLAFSVAICNGKPSEVEDFETLVEESGYEEQLAEDGSTSTDQLRHDVGDGIEVEDDSNLAAKDFHEKTLGNSVSKSISLPTGNAFSYNNYINNGESAVNQVSEELYTETDKLVKIYWPRLLIDDTIMAPVDALTDVVTLGNQTAIGELAYSNAPGKLYLFNGGGKHCTERTYQTGQGLSRELDRRTCRKLRKEMLLMRSDAEDQADNLQTQGIGNAFGQNLFYGTGNTLGSNLGALGPYGNHLGSQFGNGVNGLQNSFLSTNPYGVGNTAPGNSPYGNLGNAALGNNPFGAGNPALGIGNAFGSNAMPPNFLPNGNINYPSSLPFGQGNTNPLIGSPSVGNNFNPYSTGNYNPFAASNVPPALLQQSFGPNPSSNHLYNSNSGIPNTGANLINNNGNGLPGNAGTNVFNAANGRPGSSGANAYNGVNGLPGTAGANAYNGVNGLPGSAGANAYSGVNGLPGTAGANAYNGVNGLPGTAGANAYNGVNGLPGTAGANAHNGLNGLPGTAGANAYNGDNGLPGSAGSNGPNVSPGNAGTNIYNGANGSTGNAGTQIQRPARRPNASPTANNINDLSNWLQ